MKYYCLVPGILHEKIGLTKNFLPAPRFHVTSQKSIDTRV